MMYKLTTNRFGEINGVCFIDGSGNYHGVPNDPANTDYQQYLKWLAEGNTPEPADEPAQGEQA